MAIKKASIKATCIQTITSTQGSLVRFAADVDPQGKTAKTVIDISFADTKAVAKFESKKDYLIEIAEL